MVPLYEELLCAFLNSQDIKTSNDAFDSFFRCPTRKLNKIELLEARIDMWARENGYTHANFINKPE